MEIISIFLSLHSLGADLISLFSFGTIYNKLNIYIKTWFFKLSDRFWSSNPYFNNMILLIIDK